VDYATVAIVAVAGQDYIAQNGTLVFQTGQTMANVVIPILNDTVAEGNETFGFTIDRIVGDAPLLVPRTATITINDNDVSLPNFTNFNSAASLQLNGSASSVNGTLLLTEDRSTQKGSVFYQTAIPVGDSTSFQTSFGFRIDGVQGTGGADGFAYVIQNSPAGVAAISPDTGGSLGYTGMTDRRQSTLRLMDAICTLRTRLASYP